jgi:signal transduction histidine kinase
MQVYKNNVLVYDSIYPDEEMIQENEEETAYYSWPSYYHVMFADGDAVVLLYGFYSYRIYDYVLFAELFASFLLFLLIVMLGIRKSMRYIRQLSNEIRILEGGDLDYPITVRGKDELAILAKGIDDMRKAFQEQLASESYLMRSNQKLLSQMSHDLRTPLTTILLYTNILKEHRYNSEEELAGYLERLEVKSLQLKKLTDNLFSYTLVSKEAPVELEQPEAFGALFEEQIREMAVYLEQNDYFVITPETFPQEMVRINSEYMARIPLIRRSRGMHR